MATTVAGFDYEEFVNNWNIDVSTGRIYRQTEIITAVHGLAVYEWKLTLSADNEYNFLRGSQAARSRAGAQCHLILEPSFLFESARMYVLRGVILFVEAKTFDGQSLLGPVRHVMKDVIISSSAGEPCAARVLAESNFGRTLQEICSGQSGAATLHITTILQIPKSCFELDIFLKAAQAPPASRPSLFRVINDPALHNVRLRCQDGIFPCNRTALFQTSHYFRQLLRNNRPEYEEDCTLAALSTVLVFMLTGTYHQEGTMTVKLTEEIIHLIRRYRPSIVNPLHTALEKTACERLVSEGDCLEKVLKWYLAAADCDMPRLQNVATALLLKRHYNQLAVEFIVAEPRKPHLRELHEKLHGRGNIFRGGPLQKILRHRSNAMRHLEKMTC